MKICFFANVPSKPILSTVEFYAQDIRLLQELGHDVRIATDVGRVPMGCDLYFVWWWSYALEPVLKALVQRKPVIVTGAFQYDAPPELTSARISYLSRPVWQRQLILRAAQLATVNVPLCEFEAKEMREQLGLRNTEMMYCGVDTTRYVPSEGEKDKFLLNVAWSGAVNGERKCLAQIVEAFCRVAPEIPEYRLVMAGREGEFHPRLVEIVRRYGMEARVEFLGVIEEGEKIRMMQRCAAYVQPTLFEGFGLAIAEAMACGAPVITSGVGSLTEVVGEAGLLVDGRRVEEIGEAMKRMVREPETRERFARLGRAHIEARFSMDAKRARLNEILAIATR